MLQHAGFYNAYIAAGFSVLHDLTMFMPQALCDELGCNVHPATFQLGWCSTLHDGAAHPASQRVKLRCNTSCPFLCRWAVAWRSHRLAGLALLLVLPAHVAALTPVTQIGWALNDWKNDPVTAATTWGPIADWNTAAVTTMDQVSAAPARRAQCGGSARSV
jgi:hypothetical protein